MPRRGFRGVAYRHHAAAYGALSGEGARQHGGRWNPAASFPVVYAASDPQTVDAEFQRLLDRSGLAAAALQPRQLSTLRLDLDRVLDLRDREVLQALGVTRDDLVADDPSLTQTIGDVAHELGYEAVIGPSAAGPGDVVALFPTNRAAGSRTDVVGVRPYRAGLTD